MPAPTAARKRSRRRFFELAGICFGAAVVVLLATQFIWIAPLVEWEWNLEDRVLAQGNRRSLADDFVFVEIDEPSLRLDQLWPEDIAASPALTAMASGFPWPRNVYAEAVEKILAAGARVVVLDFVFPDQRPGDESFRTTLDRHPSRVVIGANFDVATQEGTTSRQSEITLPASSLASDPAADPRVGFVNFWPDIDRVVRSARFQTTALEAGGLPARPGERVYQSLAAVALRQIGEADRLPGDSSSHLFRYARQETIPRVPFYSLFLASDWSTTLVNGGVFKDRIVVIGPSAPLMQDFHRTPVNNALEGPLLHVNVIAAALGGDFYRRSGGLTNASLIVLAGAAALTIVRRFRHPLITLGVMVGAAVIYVAAIFTALHLGNVMLPILYPISTLLFGVVACIAWNFSRERAETSRLRSTLDRYVSRNVVREILDNREDFLTSLGGTRRPMTILFSDVRGFTSFSEHADAASVVEQLNEYLGEMVRIIFANGGTLDKFMGDGIMAVWGNVLTEGPAADATHALRAAIAMRDQIQTLNDRWRDRGIPEFAVGIGLHHGEAIFGNMGSDEKMEPTVIGDAVNLASRVEGLTKKYGVSICITESVAALTRDGFYLQSVDLVQVIGRSAPVGIFHPLTGRDADAPPWLEPFERAMRDFRARQFDAALAGFTACAALLPGDKLCALYVTRSQEFLTDPPPADWTGTEAATSK